MADERPGWPPASGGNGAGPPGIPDVPAPSSPSRSPVRWGLGDFVLAVVVGIVGATLATIPFVRADETIPASGLVASMLGQSAATLGFLELIARFKGRGSLTTDFGLLIRPRDLGWVAAGLGISLVLGLALVPLSELAGDDAGQEVVDQFEAAEGTVQLLFAVGVVLVAPVIEELVYRGLLLRSLLRRTSPAAAVFVSGVVFGAVHVLFDPGAYVVLPALVALGCLCGILAVRAGNLSRPILLHAGFNLLTTVQIVGALHLAH